MTDEQGRFFFADLPAGRHVIQTLHISYHDTRFAVEITAGDTARVDLHIGHQELHLEGVHIEGQRGLPRWSNPTWSLAATSSDKTSAKPLPKPSTTNRASPSAPWVRLRLDPCCAD